MLSYGSTIPYTPMRFPVFSYYNISSNKLQNSAEIDFHSSLSIPISCGRVFFFSALWIETKSGLNVSVVTVAIVGVARCCRYHSCRRHLCSLFIDVYQRSEIARGSGNILEATPSSDISVGTHLLEERLFVTREVEPLS